ncbi:hypothetical protein ACN469_00070 [Corallococcus terminator]
MTGAWRGPTAAGASSGAALIRGRLRLNGWRLEAGRRAYTPILPQHGVYRSEVLGLDLQIEDERLRFYFGGAPLPEAHELIARLERMVERVEASRLELENQLAEEVLLREEETQRREDAERRLAEALAELASSARAVCGQFQLFPFVQARGSERSGSSWEAARLDSGDVVRVTAHGALPSRNS